MALLVKITCPSRRHIGVTGRPGGSWSWITPSGCFTLRSPILFITVCNYSCKLDKWLYRCTYLPIRWVLQMWAPLAACREPAGSYDRVSYVLYVMIKLSKPSHLVFHTDFVGFFLFYKNPSYHDIILNIKRYVFYDMLLIPALWYFGVPVTCPHSCYTLNMSP